MPEDRHERAWPVRRTKPLDAPWPAYGMRRERGGSDSGKVGCGHGTLFVLTDWNPEPTTGVELRRTWRVSEPRVRRATGSGRAGDPRGDQALACRVGRHDD